jgi:hypothetical protein
MNKNDGSNDGCGGRSSDDIYFKPHDEYQETPSKITSWKEIPILNFPFKDEELSSLGADNLERIVLNMRKSYAAFPILAQLTNKEITELYYGLSSVYNKLVHNALYRDEVMSMNANDRFGRIVKDANSVAFEGDKYDAPGKKPVNSIAHILKNWEQMPISFSAGPNDEVERLGKIPVEEKEKFLNAFLKQEKGNLPREMDEESFYRMRVKNNIPDYVQFIRENIKDIWSRADEYRNK